MPASKIIAVRFPVELAEQIEATVARLRLNSKGGMDRNTWIVRACKRDLDHNRRSSGRKRKNEQANNN